MAEFYLAKDDSRNTTISQSDNQTAYVVETPTRFFHTERTSVWKGEKDSSEPRGVIEFHGLHDDICELNGKSVLPHKAKESNAFSNSKEFVASDGKAYKWKHHRGIWELLTQDGSHTVVSRCEKKNISVFHPVLHIIDEVILTLLYMKQLKKRADAAAAAGATSAASSASASSAAAATAC